MSVSKRIKEFIDNQGFKVAAVSRETGIKVGTLRTLFKRDSSPSADIVAQLNQTYPELNIEWLLTGKGNMLKTEQSTSCQDCEEKLKLAELVIETQKELIEQLRKD